MKLNPFSFHAGFTIGNVEHGYNYSSSLIRCFSIPNSKLALNLRIGLSMTKCKLWSQLYEYNLSFDKKRINIVPYWNLKVSVFLSVPFKDAFKAIIISNTQSNYTTIFFFFTQILLKTKSYWKLKITEFFSLMLLWGSIRCVECDRSNQIVRHHLLCESKQKINKNVYT